MAVTLVLFAIMISHALLRVLVKAAGGQLSVDVVLPLLVATSINLLVTIVPLGLYLGIILGLGRLYQDSEMVVLSACGVGVKRLYRPVLVLGFLGILITLPLTTLVSPWAENWEQTIKADTSVNNLVALMREGKFVESQNGNLVMFAQTLPEGDLMQGVFLRQKTSDGHEALERASSAHYQFDQKSGEQYLVFVDGERTTLGVGEKGHQVIEFAKHGVLVPKEGGSSSTIKRLEKPTLDLIYSTAPADRAEFYWRIGIPFAAPLLAFLALPLSHTSPRKGRYGKVAIAILIYIAYTNLLVLSRKWIATEQIPAWLGLWWVHILLFMLALFLLRHTNNVRFFKRVKASAT